MSEKTAPSSGRRPRPPTGRLAPLPGSTLPAVLEEFLVRASQRGESAVALARTVVCALALTRVLAFYAPAIANLEPKPLVSALGISAGLVFSSLSLLRKAVTPTTLRLISSVIVDTCVVLVAVAPILLWPHDDYRGILREFDTSAFLLVIVAAGARLSPTVALAGGVANAVALTALIASDHLLQPQLVGYPVGDIVLSYVLLAGATTLAYAIAKGTRMLVAEGSEAVLRAERARQRLGVYVSEEVAADLDRTDDAPELGGAKRDVAVLFSDLRGFTRFSEKLDPEGLVAELNAYLEAMVAAIRAEGGVIDKYIGDSIMALFGAPDTRPDAAAAAVRAAAAMQRALRQHNLERVAAGRPPLAHGIGIHFGSCVWGNIGTYDRMQYTVIGDAVNLASRLESATKEHGCGVLLSADTATAARDRDALLPALVAKGTIKVRGREQELEVLTFADPALSAA